MITEIKMRHESGVEKIAYDGFSWTALIFGFFVPLFRGDWKWFAIALAASLINSAMVGIGIGLITTPIWWIAFAVKYNQFHKEDLMIAGFKQS